MKKDYIINHGEQTITITKAFAARAADISTREYRELTKLHRDFPDYTIQHRTAVIRADKATCKGLTLDEMEKYIKAHDSSGEGVKAFEAIKVYHTPTGKDKPSYPKVKAWFLRSYPQIMQLWYNSPQRRWKNGEKELQVMDNIRYVLGGRKGRDTPTAASRVQNI